MDKPLYVSEAKHKFLKMYVAKKGGKLKILTDKVLTAGIKALKLKK